MAFGLLVVRLVVGSLMAAHGAQKLLGWFGGYGLSGTGVFFEQLGFKPGRVFAAAAAGGEVASGLLVALGFGGPVGPAVMLSVMIVAAISVHWAHGVFATSNGIELPLLYAAVAVALAFTGYGQYSLDGVFGMAALWAPVESWGALALAVAAGFVSLAARHAPAVSNAHA